MSELLTERSGRIVAVRKLTRRSGRDDAGFFLAELAVNEPAAFAALVETSRAAVAAAPANGSAAA